ncbi:hypothetical protein GW17_00042314 [Ensete ventricosum]|nr:hypothetical protein GW17_00042314 [Ensete ventricosum]RZS00467.1 hypothetical protein BHM03_00030157 [Ensete ventricosum]
MSIPNEVFDIVFEVVTLLRIMYVLPVEMTVSSFVAPFRVCLDWVRGCDDPFLLDLKEKFYLIESEERVSGSGVARVESRGWLTNRAVVTLGVPNLILVVGHRYPSKLVDLPELVVIKVVFAGVLAEEPIVGMSLTTGVGKCAGR